MGTRPLRFRRPGHPHGIHRLYIVATDTTKQSLAQVVRRAGVHQRSNVASRNTATHIRRIPGSGVTPSSNIQRSSAAIYAGSARGSNPLSPTESAANLHAADGPMANVDAQRNRSAKDRCIDHYCPACLCDVAGRRPRRQGAPRRRPARPGAPCAWLSSIGGTVLTFRPPPVSGTPSAAKVGPPAGTSPPVTSQSGANTERRSWQGAVDR